MKQRGKSNFREMLCIVNLYSAFVFTKFCITFFARIHFAFNQHKNENGAFKANECEGFFLRIFNYVLGKNFPFLEEFLKRQFKNIASIIIFCFLCSYIFVRILSFLTKQTDLILFVIKSNSYENIKTLDHRKV